MNMSFDHSQDSICYYKATLLCRYELLAYHTSNVSSSHQSVA